jgi:hypothetical protein
VIGSYHTALAAYAGIRSGQAQLEALAGMALAAFYGACGLVLSPSPASDERLAALGKDALRSRLGDRGHLPRLDRGRSAGARGECDQADFDPQGLLNPGKKLPRWTEWWTARSRRATM